MRKSVVAVYRRAMRTLGAMLIPGLVLLLALIPATVINMATPGPVSAAIQQRGSATTGTTTGTSLTIDKPTGVAVGDVLIANIAKVGNNTTEPSSGGWVLMDGISLGGGGTQRYGAVLWRVVDGTEGATFTFALGPGTDAAVGTVVAFSGVNTSGSTPFDVDPGDISVLGGADVVATAIDTASSNAAVIMFGMAAGSAPTWSGWTTTLPGSLNELYDSQITGADEASVGAAWAVKATAGATGTGAATLSSAERNGGILIALKPLKPAELTVSSATGTYGDAVSLVATLSPAMSGETISFTLNGAAAGTAVTDDSGVAKIPAASLHGIDAGSYPNGVGASLVGGADSISLSNTASLTVRPRDIRVTAHEKGKVYGDPDPALTYQITLGSLAAGDAFSGALIREAGEDVGTYAIQQGTLALNSNYSLTVVESTLAVNVRNIAVAADDCGKAYGDEDPALTYQITLGSLAEGDAFSGKLEREPGEDLGTYAIRQGTLALNNNYNLTFVDGTFTISIEGPSTPTVSGISPQSGRPGETLDVVISGSNLTGATAVDFGTNVTVNSFEVENATRIVANITIDSDAEPGDSSIVITMPSGGVRLPGAFSIELSTGTDRGSGLWFLLILVLLAAGLGLLLFWWFNRRKKRGDLELAPAPVPNRPPGGTQEAVDLRMAPAAAPVREFQEAEMPSDEEHTPTTAANQPLQATTEVMEPEVASAVGADQPSEVTEIAAEPEQAPVAAVSEPPGETEKTAEAEPTPMATAASEPTAEPEKTAEMPEAAALAAAPGRPRRRTKTKVADSEQATGGAGEPSRQAQRKAPASSRNRARKPTKRRKKGTG